MTLEFEEQLQQKFNNLTKEDITDLFMSVKPYLKSDLYCPVTEDNIQAKEFASVVLDIGKFYIERKMLSFKQWKTVNGYLIRKTKNQQPIIYKNFNTTK